MKVTTNYAPPEPVLIPMMHMKAGQIGRIVGAHSYNSCIVMCIFNNSREYNFVGRTTSGKLISWTRYSDCHVGPPWLVELLPPGTSLTFTMEASDV